MQHESINQGLPTRAQCMCIGNSPIKGSRQIKNWCTRASPGCSKKKINCSSICKQQCENVEWEQKIPNGLFFLSSLEISQEFGNLWANGATKLMSDGQC